MLDNNLNNLKSKTLVFKDNLIKSKKYWIIYICLILLFSISKLTPENFMHPKMEIIFFILVSILGIFIITFFHGHNDNKNIHKNAFIIILIFGILCAFLTPVLLVPDEGEHFVRSEITSQGILLPQPHNHSFSTIQTSVDFVSAKYTEQSTVFNINYKNVPINYSSANFGNAFAQNPFYGYLFQAIGMLMAKLLDLNAIWLLWLGRIFNVVLYASLVTIAIKKTPILKVPMLAFSCIPLAIYLCGSMSIDSFINGMGILSIAYFFYLYKTPNLNKIHVLKFSILIVLLGTCKVTFFALILLLLLIPKDNFKEDKKYIYCLSSIIIIGVIAILWNKFYATPGVLTSTIRQNYFIENNINSTKQVNYILSHKKDFLITLIQLPKYLTANLNFSYNMGIDYLYLLFFGSIIFLYPKPKDSFKTKLGLLIICAIIYIGTYVSLLLIWTPVGNLNLIEGVQPRYFLPLLTCLPFIFGFNNLKGDTSKIDSYVIMLSLVFLSILVLERVILSY